MARYAKKAGTQQLRYQFDIELYDLKITIPYEVTCQVVWKKDEKRIETKNNPKFGGKVEQTTFGGEKLSMLSTLIKDKKKGTFAEKTSQLVIKITKGEKTRSIGQCVLNLSNYIDKPKSDKIKMKIEKCPDPEAYMVFSVSSSCINITSGSETMSMMSGVMGADVMSIDSGPETEFNF